MPNSASSPAPSIGTSYTVTFPADLTAEEEVRFHSTGKRPVRVAVPATASTAVETVEALRGHQLQIATVERVVEEKVAALKDGELPDSPFAMKKARYAKRCDYSVRYLDQLIEAGLPTIGKGKALRIPVKEADEWLLDLGSPQEGEIESQARIDARRRRNK